MCVFVAIVKCVFALQGYARYPVDESRSSQADGGAEPVHLTGRVQGDAGQSPGDA